MKEFICPQWNEPCHAVCEHREICEIKPCNPPPTEYYSERPVSFKPNVIDLLFLVFSLFLALIIVVARAS